MKLLILIVLSVTIVPLAYAQDIEAQGDYGEVFGFARSNSETGDCEPSRPLPETREEWEAVVAKIESGIIDKATTGAFISGKMPYDLHTEELGRKFHKAHYDYITRKIEKPLTGCDVYSNVEVFGMKGAANHPPLPSQEELNAIWQSMLSEVEKQRQSEDISPKAD